MSAFAQPKVTRTAVFVKEESRNQKYFSRRPWDFVDLDFGTDFPNQNRRMVQLFVGGHASRTTNFVYNDVMIVDRPFLGDPVGPGSTI